LKRLRVAEGLSKGFGLGCALFEQIHKRVQLRAAAHVRAEGHVVNHGPGFGVEEFLALLIFHERAIVCGEHLRHRDKGLAPQEPVADGGCADVDVVALEASVAVELSEAFIEPGGQPMEVGVEDAVRVFVKDDGLVEIAEGIETNHGVLSLPALEEFAGPLIALFPEDGRERAQAVLTHGDDEQGCACFERPVAIANRKDGAHLLEFFGDVATVAVGAVGDYREVGGSNLAPGLS